MNDHDNREGARRTFRVGDEVGVAVPRDALQVLRD